MEKRAFAVVCIASLDSSFSEGCYVFHSRDEDTGNTSMSISLSCSSWLWSLMGSHKVLSAYKKEKMTQGVIQCNGCS